MVNRAYHGLLFRLLRCPSFRLGTTLSHGDCCARVPTAPPCRCADRLCTVVGVASHRRWWTCCGCMFGGCSRLSSYMKTVAHLHAALATCCRRSRGTRSCGMAAPDQQRACMLARFIAAVPLENWSSRSVVYQQRGAFSGKIVCQPLCMLPRGWNVCFRKPTRGV